jgi:phosphatidylglycerophosphate synthase
MTETFQGDRKEGQSLLHGPEEKLKKLLLPLVPRWLETYHLTLTTIAWSLLVIFFSFLAQSDIRWLWGASAMIVMQYITDLLDGAIGRQRDTGLIKWGYYMDHFLDYIFLCSILIGYALLVRDHHNYMLFFILAIFGAFMVNSFLAFAATNKFRISYLGIGPTEIRIVFIIVNAVLVVVADSQKIEACIPYILWLATFGLFVTVYRTQEHIWDLDMRAKHGDEAFLSVKSGNSIRGQEWSLYLSRRKVARNLALSLLIAFVALTVLMMRFMAPHHRWIALGIYILSWMPFLWSFRNRHALLLERGRQIKKIAVPLMPYVLVGLILALSAHVAHVLIPVEDTALLDMTDADLRLELDEDLQMVAALDSQMDSLLEWIEKDRLFEQDFGKLAPADKDRIKDAWMQFADLSLQLDILKSKYKGFYQIDRMTKRELHADAFAVQFAALLAQYRSTLRIVEAIDRKPYMATLLNEGDRRPRYEMPPESYTQVKQRLTQPDIMIRLNAWSCYLPLLRNDFSEQNRIGSELQDRVEDIFRRIGKRPSLLASNPRDIFERKAFKAWFPFQKEVAIQIGRIRSPAHEYRIDAQTVKAVIPELQPGDILLQRREWKMSNISIPGFWTHSAIYTGTLATIDEHFKGLSLPEGRTPSEHIAAKYPEAHAELESLDRDGYPRAVIEALSPGVVLNSCESSLNADYVAALRPRLSRDERFEALCNALSHFGQDYDFNFDFASDRSLVCSELVYKSLIRFPGIELPLKSLNGRQMFTPNDFASIFDAEFGKSPRQFDFVFFLDSEGKELRKRDAAAFRKSWLRPKWEILF